MILKIGTIREDDGKAAKAATKMVWAGVWLYSVNRKMNKLQTQHPISFHFLQWFNIHSEITEKCNQEKYKYI